MTTTIDTVRALARQRRQRGNIADYYATEGMHRVGAGLYLRVLPSAKTGWLKTWGHRYQYLGKARTDWLGSAHAVTVENAALAVDAAKMALAKGHDPRGERAVTKVAPVTFKDAAEQFLAKEFPASATDGLPDADKLAQAPKHIKQWHGSVRATYPVLGDLMLGQIEADHVSDALEPDWKRVPETARRVRGRLWNILDWAIAKKMRTDKFNPADRSTIEKLLRDNSNVKPKIHHAAMSWREVPGFARELAGEEGLSAIALGLLVRTLKRHSEVLLAHKTEFFLDRATWVIPRARMKIKVGAPHQVPLSTGAIAVIEPLLKMNLPGPYLFPGMKPGQALSHMVMLNRLDRMGYGIDSGQHFTPHGFRSSFKEWSRSTKQDRELAELSLDHLFGDDTERAYARDQLLEERRPLMQAWDDFLAGRDKIEAAPSNVVPLRAVA